MTIQKGRKVRSDKKREVKPTLKTDLKECLYRLSYITNTPVKELAERMCMKGITSQSVLSYLSNSFRRTVRVGSTLYMGNLDRPSLQVKSKSTLTSKITIKFSQSTYDAICVIAYALDVTPTRATALLLHASLYHSDFTNTFVRTHIENQLDGNRMKELRKVLQYINSSSDSTQRVSWTSFLSVIYDEFLTGTNSVSDSIQDFLDIWKT